MFVCLELDGVSVKLAILLGKQLYHNYTTVTSKKTFASHLQRGRFKMKWMRPCPQHLLKCKTVSVLATSSFFNNKHSNTKSKHSFNDSLFVFYNKYGNIKGKYSF